MSDCAQRGQFETRFVFASLVCRSYAFCFIDIFYLVPKKAHNRHKPIIKKAQASTAAKAAVEACVSKHIDAKGMRIVGAMVDVSEMIIKIFQIACVVASHMTLNLFL